LVARACQANLVLFCSRRGRSNGRALQAEQQIIGAEDDRSVRRSLSVDLREEDYEVPALCGRRASAPRLPETENGTHDG